MGIGMYRTRLGGIVQQGLLLLNERLVLLSLHGYHELAQSQGSVGHVRSRSRHSTEGTEIQALHCHKMLFH
jgi:hypothetical protein